MIFKEPVQSENFANTASALGLAQDTENSSGENAQVWIQLGNTEGAVCYSIFPLTFSIQCR